MFEFIPDYIVTSPFFKPLAVLAGSLLVAGIADVLFSKVLPIIVGKTETILDDQIISIIRKPLFASVLLLGTSLSLKQTALSPKVIGVLDSILIVFAVLLWTGALAKVARLVLNALAANDNKYRLIQTHSLPFFGLLLKGLIYGVGLYIVLLAWKVDVTAWVASAGIIGIAVGFAAKDTLANLFSGIFILADAPYKLGDFILLGTGQRGCVTDIGMRSTRLLSEDHIEMIIPNAVIANTMIVNESGGPHVKERIRVDVSVAWGSDIERVREVLTEIAHGAQLVLADPEPSVQFISFGESALNFQLRGWIEEPVFKGRAIDELLTAIYHRFNAEGIRFPFPQRDVWLHSPETSTKP